MVEHVLIIADIEGSSACFDYEASKFLTYSWPAACLGMTRDVAGVVTALFEAGVKRVTVKDFHRTGYNLFEEFIDPRAHIISGYRFRPIPGLGDPGDAEAVLFIGMHASSGSGGFLAHTFTSRISLLEINGKPVSELELFASALYPWNLRPVFFSGDATACREAGRAIPGIRTFPLDKFPATGDFEPLSWRKALAAEAVASLEQSVAEPCLIQGPYAVTVHFRDGEAEARKAGNRWNFAVHGATVNFFVEDFPSLWLSLIRLCYLTPFIERILPLGLGLYNLVGRLGRLWAKNRAAATQDGS